VICVDANVVAKLLFREEDSDKAFALFESCAMRGETVISTPLIGFEVTNVIRKRMWREDLQLDDARRLIGRFRTYPIELEAVAGMHDLALSLATEFDLRAAYDAHYIVLARERGCDLWTADARLLNNLRSRLSFVRSLADFSTVQFS
jgi:predicted nucleic acid-binding protein